jgi:2-keto-4-pentenoate hydratase
MDALMTSCPPPEGARQERAAQAWSLGLREHRRITEALREAERDRRPIDPPSASYPGFSLEDGRRVRDLGLTSRLAGGERWVGSKVSLSAPGEPVNGAPRARLAWLTDAMLLDRGEVDVDAFIQPRLEPKLAFRLGSQITAPVMSFGKVLAATELVHPCLEVVDSRYRVGGGLADAVADNCGTAAVLLGEGVAPPAEGRLRRLWAEVEDDDEASHAGDASPPPVALGAMAWLAHTALEEGHPLRAGTVLVSPAIGPAARMTPGTTVTVRFRGLGPLAVHVTGSGRTRTD